jgi:hypothetical protein
MLTLKNKADIYDLLKLGFKEEERIPLATLALYLNSKKFSYQEYGYKKLKSLLNDLSFLSYETDEKNPSDVYVRIHAFDSGEKNKVEKKPNGPHIPEKDCKKLVELLYSNYEPGKDYPLSNVSKFLSDNNVDYKKYGFARMRKMLESLKEVLILKEDKKDKSIMDVHFIEAKIKPVAPKKNAAPAKLPPPSKDCFFVPNNLLLSIKEFTNIGLDNDSILSLLHKDYEKAYKSNAFKKRDDAYVFSLSIRSRENESIVASIKKAAKGSGYSYYLNFIGSDKEKAKDCFADMIYFEDIEKSMEELSVLARKEKWCYHNSKDKHIILKIYLQYTFFQIHQQNKLRVDENTGLACFNTGLKTADYEDIYAILMRNKSKSISQEFIFQGFSMSASQGLGKLIVEHFNPLPEKATYITSSDQLVFDSRQDLHTDIRHILLDNIDRFPMEFLHQMLLPFKEEKKILDRIEKEKTPFLKEKYFLELEKHIERNETLFTLLRVSLEASINKSIRMVNYDYRNALPSFFPTRNVMSLMLPLQFTKNDEAQAVLLVEKTASGNYQGQTILTLKQCYVNARLISPLENSFLRPDKIED